MRELVSVASIEALLMDHEAQDGEQAEKMTDRISVTSRRNKRYLKIRRANNAMHKPADWIRTREGVVPQLCSRLR